MTFATLLLILLPLAHLAAVIFAAVYGTRAERTGALIYGVSIILTWTVQGVLKDEWLYPFMLLDLSTSLAFAWLALRHPEKLWPGAAACAQFFVFIFSATRAIDYPLSEGAYFAALNLAGVGVIGALGLGTWAARWGKPRIDPWEEYAATLASLPPPSPIPSRAALTST